MKTEFDWIVSDHCTECDGEGFVRFVSHDTGEYREYEVDQCEECERLCELERRADIDHDRFKEGD
jgi:hypothetical protein